MKKLNGDIWIFIANRYFNENREVLLSISCKYIAEIFVDACFIEAVDMTIDQKLIDWALKNGCSSETLIESVLIGGDVPCFENVKNTLSQYFTKFNVDLSINIDKNPVVIILEHDNAQLMKYFLDKNSLLVHSKLLFEFRSGVDIITSDLIWFLATSNIDGPNYTTLMCFAFYEAFECFKIFYDSLSFVDKDFLLKLLNNQFGIKDKFDQKEYIDYVQNH